MTTSEVLDLLNNKKKVEKRMKDALDVWREVYYGMSIHTAGIMPQYSIAGHSCKPRIWCKEWQDIFDYKLFARHPREGNLRDLRYSMYRPLTKAPLNQCLEVLSGAIFQDSNYHIEIEDKQDNDYIWGNNFHGYDLIGYFANIGINHMAEDPNGVFLRIPKAEQIEGRLDVDIWFINTKDILFLDATEILFKRDDYAYWVDTETIYRFQYVNKKYENAGGYYAHMLGYLPISIAGGYWNSQGHYDSFLDKAKPLCDEFASTFSGAQMVDKDASHPYIIEVRPDCPTCEGRRIEVKSCKYCQGTPQSPTDCNMCEYGTGTIKVPCGTCDGTGTISRNPGQHILVPQENWSDADKSISIKNPDVSINAHHRETVKQLTEDILRVLHLYRADKAESGEAKAIDLEREYKFLSKVSNQIFDKLIYDSLRDIIAYRNVSVSNGTISPARTPFTIIKPTQFKMLSSAELQERFKLSKEAGVPVISRQREWKDLVDKSYNGDAVEAKKVEVALQLDPLALYSADEILSRRAANGVTSEQIYFNTNLPAWLSKIIADKSEQWFVRASIQDIEATISPYNKPPRANELQQQATAAMQE